MSWQTKGLSKRSPWRVIRDFFDDTTYRPRMLVEQPQKPIEDSKPPKMEWLPPIEKEIPILMNPADKNAYIKSDVIEDYAAAATEDVQVVTVPVKKMYFIPVPKTEFKIERTKKVIKINLPKIKINMTMLKRWAFVSVIVSSGIIAIVALIMFSRFIAITDGDFIGETYRYKMQKFETDLSNHVEARVDDVEKRMTELEAKKEFKTFEEMTGYKPPKPKVIVINKYYKNRKAPITETISK